MQSNQRDAKSGKTYSALDLLRGGAHVLHNPAACPTLCVKTASQNTSDGQAANASLNPQLKSLGCPMCTRLDDSVPFQCFLLASVRDQPCGKACTRRICQLTQNSDLTGNVISKFHTRKPWVARLCLPKC